MAKHDVDLMQHADGELDGLRGAAHPVGRAGGPVVFGPFDPVFRLTDMTPESAIAGR